MMRSIVRDGEIIIKRKFSRDNFNKGTIPLQLQIMEADHLDSFNYVNNPDINQGIKTNNEGKVISYFLTRNHPGDMSVRTGLDISTVEVPEKEILHPMRTDRAGQLRGIPWSTSIIIRMRSIDEYEDAELMRQKIAACFTAFIKKDAPSTINILGSKEQDETDLPEKF